MKTFPLILLCFVSAGLFAQSSRPKDIKDAPQIKERIANNGQKATPEIRVSSYYGLDDKISALMIDYKIPSEFPTAVNYPEKDKYVQVANKWIRENQNKINENKKNTFITE